MRDDTCAGIERELRTLLPAVAPLRAPVEHALQGGKRARGLLLAAVGQGTALPENLLLRAAASVELLHAATLVQDDIFDRSSLRRGRPATHCVFGERIATLASDWMLAEAIRSAYRLSSEFGEALSRCTEALITAEAREFTCPASAGLSELRAAATQVARGKTGELFGLALSAPAWLGGDPAAARRLHEAGCGLGLAFQYLDDTADLYGDASAAGKPLRRDRAAGLWTLPMLDAMAMGRSRCVHLAEAVADLSVRDGVLATARSRWRHASEAVVQELPSGAAVRPLLEELTAKALAIMEREADLSAA